MEKTSDSVGRYHSGTVTVVYNVNVNYREGRRGLGPQQGGGFGAEAMYNTRF
jgi:hypothetical protein